MSSKFKLIRDESAASADENSEAAAILAGLTDRAPECTGDERTADELTADDLIAGLPPELAALASQLDGQAQRLHTAFPADGARTTRPAAVGSIAATDTAASARAAAEDDVNFSDASSPDDSADDNSATDEALQRWTRHSLVRRWSSVAAAVALALGLSLVVRYPESREQPLAPPATAGLAEPEQKPQSSAVHAVIFSELSGAEQEGLLDLISESGSIGSI